MEKKIFGVIVTFLFINIVSSIPTGNFFKTITVKQCGTSIFPPSSPDRISGGHEVMHGQYPWIVSIHKDNGKGFHHSCGGTILNENWIITAAHCVDSINELSRYLVYAGLHKQSQLKAATVQKLQISKIILHEKYDDETYDIALLKTSKPIDIAGSKGYVNRICLPKSNKDPTGYAIVAGWGAYEDGRISDTLREVVIRMKLCKGLYDDKTVICAGSTERGACEGDSGGPLVQKNKEGSYTLIGVVSKGDKGCTMKKIPDGYTKVASFMDWLDENMY